MDIIYRYDPFAPVAGRACEDAEAAIRILRDGQARHVRIVDQIRREFVGDGAAADRQVVIPIEPLALGFPLAADMPLKHSPFALVLGCSDARAPVEQIFDQSPNDVFVVRVAGNVLGVECLGSIEYAARNLTESLRLLLVLGHTGCGAVTAAVDAYLEPKDYALIAVTHPLRSLVDRIQLAVRGAAGALDRAVGNDAARRPGYREALLEVAVYLNAAVTAFDVRRELGRSDAPAPRVVYGVFDLISQRVRARPGGPQGDAGLFGDVPGGPDDFLELGLRLARDVAARGLLG